MSQGKIEIITGGMFSGKSSELLRRLRRAVYARQPVVLFKHHIDRRYHDTDVVTHQGDSFTALPITTVSDIRDLSQGAAVVGIDEVQFFGDDLVPLVEALANSGVIVILAGLNQDSDGKPFGPMPALLAIADEVTSLTAICMVCGEPATKSFHKAGKQSLVEVGANQYEARCRRCWFSGNRLG